MLQYGSLFYELNTERIICLYYYPIFCLRRISLIYILYILLDYPLLQGLLNCSFSVMMLFYLVRCRPFQDRRIQNITTWSEVSILTNFIVASVLLLEPVESIEFAAVFLAVFSVFLVNLLTLYYALKQMIKRLRTKNRVRAESITITKVSEVTCKESSEQKIFTIRRSHSEQELKEEANVFQHSF